MENYIAKHQFVFSTGSTYIVINNIFESGAILNRNFIPIVLLVGNCHSGGGAIAPPITPAPDVLIAMNLPSLKKYEDAVVPGGAIYVDSTLIHEQVARTDVTVHYIPATQMASDAGAGNLANMVMMGHVLQSCPELSFDGTETTVQKLVPAKKAALVELNLKALQLGRDYEG